MFMLPKRMRSELISVRTVDHVFHILIGADKFNDMLFIDYLRQFNDMGNIIYMRQPHDFVKYVAVPHKWRPTIIDVQPTMDDVIKIKEGNRPSINDVSMFLYGVLPCWRGGVFSAFTRPCELALAHR